MCCPTFGRSLWLFRLALASALLSASEWCAADETVIRMSVESGNQTERDSRVFAVPVSCNGTKADFVWACGGYCIMSETFAKQAGLELKANPEQAPYVDAAGKPLFAGVATAAIVLAGAQRSADFWVMRDGTYTKGMTGIIGYEIARQFQWEVDPRVPQLTIRPLRTKLSAKPIAALTLKDEEMQLWVKVTVRNAPVDVALMNQTPDVQAAADLQKLWDLKSSGTKENTASYLGAVRTQVLKGKDGVSFGKDLFEGNIFVTMLPEGPASRSGLGQSLLNRFVYCVDPELKQFFILAKATPAASQPATPGSAPSAKTPPKSGR